MRSVRVSTATNAYVCNGLVRIRSGIWRGVGVEAVVPVGVIL